MTITVLNRACVACHRALTAIVNYTESSAGFYQNYHAVMRTAVCNNLVKFGKSAAMTLSKLGKAHTVHYSCPTVDNNYTSN